MSTRAKITSVSHYLPDRIISNKELCDYFGITEKWILEKTGIKQRHYLEIGATSDLIVPTVKSLMEKRGLSTNEIDCLIVATITPDFQFPSTAAVVLKKLNVPSAWGFDIAAACSGFTYALLIASKLIETKVATKIVVCGADKMSSTLNHNDHRTTVLFGDGAGAVLLEPTDSNEYCIHNSICKLDHSGLYDVYIPGGGTYLPLNGKLLEENEHKMKMIGRNVFDKGVISMTNIINELLSEMVKSGKDFDFIIPHQANLRMLEKVSQQLNIKQDKFLMNIENVGNTSAASIPICISQYHEQATITKGCKLILCGFGSGYTYGANYLTWAY